MSKNIRLGIFGFGCVGQGLYDVLEHSQMLQASIERICVKDRNKPRSIDTSYFTFDREDILRNDEVDVVVELIDDADEAFRIVSTALRNGTHVVTANKKMLAEHFDELFKLQIEHGAALIYEGAAGGSIPIIRNLEEYYDNELLQQVEGILNGSSNYITTLMEQEQMSYEQALQLAQDKGFAESDPWLDVGGFDSKYKICLLTVHAFGTVLPPDRILNLGIQNITSDDIRFAQQRNSRIKLVAKAMKSEDAVRVYVLPHFVSQGAHLYNINHEYNAVEVEGPFSDRQTLVGKGAGSHPTGSAVLSDISALTYDYRYAYKKLKQNGEHRSLTLETDFSLKVYIRYQDRKALEQLDLQTVHEEYISESLKYIVATVGFDSLFQLYDDRDSKLFISAV